MNKIIIFSIFAFTIISCSKTMTNEDYKPDAAEGVLSQINPFEYVGEEHNACLESLALENNFKNFTDAQAANFIMNWYYSKDNIDCDFTVEELVNDANTVDFDNFSFDNEIDGWYQSNQITAEQKEILMELNGYIFIVFSNNILFNNKCDSLESNISNLNIPDSDKIILWGAVSVARNSGNFWNAAYNNTENQWNFNCNCSFHGGGSSQDLPTCVGHVIADAYGWCKGALSNIGNGNLLHNAKVVATNMSRKYDHRKDDD